MKKFTLPLIILLFSLNCNSQTIEDLFSQKNYKKLIEYENSTSLTKEECYYIGFAFFQLEDEANAIKMYDKAINLGLDDDQIYLFRGLAFRYLKQFDKAKEDFRIAILRNPQRQKNYTELANAFYFQKQYDSALVYFLIAREKEYEHGDPYLKIPNIYHIQNKLDNALEECKISASLINKDDKIYIDLLESIGILEYSYKKNYPNSIKAYTEMLSKAPEELNLYTLLIKAYYANEEFIKGDSVFNILKIKYENNELPEDLMELKGETVDGFYWNEQRISVKKYFQRPKEFAESIYKFFILDKSGDNVVKKIFTEKTELELDGVKHLLCAIDNETGTHYSYPIGWESDEIDYKKLKSYVLMILNGEMKPTASSNFGKRK